MSLTLDELYLRWLYGQVFPHSQYSENPRRSYRKFFEQLFSIEFVWFVPNDDNRAADGRALRLEFLEENDLNLHDKGWLDSACSILEMLIAFSRRLAFEVEGDPGEWFWVMIDNLKLYDLSDRDYRETKQEEVAAAFERVVWRTYEEDGEGGLFPLLDAQENQKRVELWYQASAYLLERYF